MEKRRTLTINRAPTEEAPVIKFRNKVLFINELVPNNKLSKRCIKSGVIDKQHLAERKVKSVNTKSAMKWLVDTFPQTFNPKNVVILEIGIHRKLLEAHKAAGGAEVLGFGWNPLKRALLKWTSMPIYLRLVAKSNSKRICLDGSFSEVVSDEHRRIAKKVKKINK